MATIEPVTVERENALLVVWPALDAPDDGAPVDLSRFSQISVVFEGTFADTDSFALQQAPTMAGTFVDMVDLDTEADLDFSDEADADAKVFGGSPIWVRPAGSGSTGVGVSEVTVALMATRISR